jgi:hypothetical protein
MEKITLGDKKYGNFKNDQNRIEAVRQNIIDKTGILPASIKLSNSKIIVKTKNNYEAIEIRMKLQQYLEDNNIKVV